jgi:DNA topoisomerase-1
MRDQHVDVSGAHIRFHFRGKGGKQHVIDVRDPRLARIVKRRRDVPGYELFQYVDENGEHRGVQADDFNAYLREIRGQEFSAKDFRTWAGTVLAAWALQEFEAFDPEAQAKRNVVRAIEAVAERLGNTPAISRRCYVHPAVLDAYLDGSLVQSLRERVEEEAADSLHALPPEEAAVLALLHRRLGLEASTAPGDRTARSA